MVLAHSGSGFSWAWHPHIDVWLLMASLIAGYFLALRVLAPQHAPAGAPAATRKQKILFVSGVLILWVGADWPMHELSEDFLFSIHMLQHTLFSLVAPPLILLGLPAWLIRTAIPNKRALRYARFLTRPVFALLLFNGVIVVTHWPALVDLALRVELIHFAVHVVLVSTAFLMWWPVVDPLPELSRLSEPSKMLYLFLQSIVPTVPASFLTFAEAPIYHFYEAVPRLWGISVLGDQQAAGLIMKLLGGAILWLIIAVIFFRWNSREESPLAQPAAVAWDDFERELQAWDLRK